MPIDISTAKAAAYDHGSGRLAILSSDDVNDAKAARLDMTCSCVVAVRFERWSRIEVTVSLMH